MSEQKNHSLDVLGVKPIADSVNILSKAIVDGSSAFLSRICLPAAEEFGLFLQDHVRHWRAANATKIIENAASIVNSQPDADERHAQPRLISQIIEHGSWIDSAELQKMWSGLLASSCTIDGSDDSNLIFVDTLARLTLIEARILEYACRESTKSVSEAGWLMAQYFSVSLEQLEICAGTLGLIELHAGFAQFSTNADITPSAFALQMYARCNGWSSNPLEFFGLTKLSNIRNDEPTK